MSRQIILDLQKKPAYYLSLKTLVLEVITSKPFLVVDLFKSAGKDPMAYLIRFSLLAGLVVGLLLVVVLSSLLQVPSVAQLQGPQVLDALESPYGSGLFVTLMNSLLWFFGIHGVYAMQPLFDVLDQAVVLNSTALAAGEPIKYMLNSGLLGSFAFIGGSGGAGGHGGDVTLDRSDLGGLKAIIRVPGQVSIVAPSSETGGQGASSVRTGHGDEHDA